MKNSCTPLRIASPETSSPAARRRRSSRDRALRLLLAGPFPEPIGGVSVHLRRLWAWLQAQGISVDPIDEARHRKKEIYNLRSLRFLSYLRRVSRCNVAHIHSSVPLFRIVHILACRLLGLRVIVTIHSWRRGGCAMWASRLFLRLADRILAVSQEIQDDLGLRHCQVVPAFLPAVDGRQGLPGEITAFIAESRARGCHLVCANAYKLQEHLGQDLYGLDLCVELVDLLTRRAGVQVALIFVISCDATGNRLYLEAQEQIRRRNLESRFCLYNQPVDFVTLMKQCDLVLRPTNTDGDAVTIREALYGGVPVIASDAVQRPPGTILFRSRDVHDLMVRTRDVLEKGTHRAGASVPADADTYFMKYLDLYLEVLTSHGTTHAATPIR
ncbi:MAG: glycosyltransferase [Planctomycetes bacterium]|nr:glycosyltransferase [Planctomycetota bacterium]